MNFKNKPIPPLRAKFIEVADQRRLAANTRKAYSRWIREFIKFHHPRKPIELGEPEIALFLTVLVTKKGVTASTQRLALNAVIFLFRYVLNKNIGKLPSIPRALRRTRKNSALTRSEFQSLLLHIPEKLRLVFLVMYGCGLRITEATSLTMRDILWDEELIIVRNTKARGDRAVRIPTLLQSKLSAHVSMRRQWQFTLEKKRHPNISKFAIEDIVAAYWNDENLFVGTRARYDQELRRLRMRRLSASFLQRVFKKACTAAKLSKSVTPHSLRYSFATEAIAAGNNIAELQVTLGHKDPNTTAGYVDVLKTIRRVTSPLDTLILSDQKDYCPHTKIESSQKSILKSFRRALRDLVGRIKKVY